MLGVFRASHLWMCFTEPLEEADPQAALLCSPRGNQGGQLIVITHQSEGPIQADTVTCCMMTKVALRHDGEAGQ